MLIVLVGVYVVGAVVMFFVEPADSPLRGIKIFTWWFFVTAATVGYGDVVPQSDAGKLMGIVTILLSIGSLAYLFSRWSNSSENLSRKGDLGLIQHHEKNHIVILGYTPTRTKRLIDELRAMVGKSSPILVGYDGANPMTNPLSELALYVSGDFTSSEFHTNANIAHAQIIILDTGNDEKNVELALLYNALSPSAHIVVALNEVERHQHIIKKIDKEIECVQAGVISLIAQSAINSGISLVYEKLMSSLDTGQTLFRLNLPSNFAPTDFDDLLVQLRKKYKALLVAVSTSQEPGSEVLENPDSLIVTNAMALFYIASQPIASVEL